MTKHQIPLLSTRAAVQPQTYNEEARTVDLVWTTGAQVRRFDWMEGPYLEELSLDPKAIRMERLNTGAPLLANHDSRSLDAVIGVVEKAWIDGNEGRATVRFSDREDVQSIISDVRAGILRNISVGYQVHEYEVEKPQERGGMPTYRAVDWEPMELSIVTIPADSSAQIRGSHELHPVTIHDRSTAMSDTEDQIPAEDEKPVLPAEPTEAPVDVAEVVRSALEVERKRNAGIRETVRMAKLDESIAEKLIDSGKPLDDCRAEVLRMWSEKVDSSATDSGRSDDEVAHETRSADLAKSILNQVAGVK
jgi:phage head maturation protease